MKNCNTTQKKFQQKSRRELLESTKLSRLPERTLFTLPDFDNAPTNSAAVAVVCAGCNGRLDAGDNFQQSVMVCRKCLVHYAKIDTAIDEAEKRKRRELLEKFAAEVI